MAKKQQVYINKYCSVMLVFCLIFSLILITYLFKKNLKLEEYITLVENKYNIATEQSIQKRIATDFTFSRNDAFGIIFNDLPEVLPSSFTIDPNFIKYFAWKQNGKLTDLTKKSFHINIGIPLKPNDIENDSPEKITYVMNVFNDLQKVFEKNEFTKDTQFNKVSVPTFDNISYENFVAYINKQGIKCSIYYPNRCNYSFDSLRISAGRSFCTYAFIYIACAD
jgi:hypothetical protein